MTTTGTEEDHLPIQMPHHPDTDGGHAPEVTQGLARDHVTEIGGRGPVLGGILTVISDAHAQGQLHTVAISPIIVDQGQGQGRDQGQEANLLHHYAML